MKSLYEFLLKDNAKLLQMIFIEKQRGNINNVVDLLRQLKQNYVEIDKIEKNTRRENGGIYGTKKI